MDASAWPELMTVAEVAVILRVSKMTVYRMATDGELDSRRIGRSYRILAGSLRDYLSAAGPAGVPTGIISHGTGAGITLSDEAAEQLRRDLEAVVPAGRTGDGSSLFEQMGGTIVNPEKRGEIPNQRPRRARA